MSPDHEFDEIREIVDEFMIEAEELVSNLDRDLVEIERTPDDPELLNSIFRSAHTLKGTSGFLGFANLSNLTHNMEDVLNKLRKCELRLNADMIDVLLECVDTIRRMLDDIGSTGAETESDIADVVARLKAAERGVESSVADRRNAPRTKGKSESEKGNEAELKSRSPRTNSVERLVSQESDATGQESSVGGGSNTAVDNPDSISNQDMKAAASSSDYTARDGRREFMDRRRTDPTIRVDVQRLDSLMNMVGELVLGRNALAQVERDISSRLEGSREKEKLTQTTNQVSFITTELQMAVMKLRMLPIGNVFNKFPRVVRDLARDQNKLIDLEVSGEDTELDKTVIEEIGDPLVHLIRNSCDHGIESPEIRRELGKPERGKLSLIAEQEGSNIVIRVTDDGRGIDVDRVAERAIERGLATPESVAAISDRDIVNFIFHAGFSTAKKVTDISGRGVGMDVVRTNIEKLNGTIDIESSKGEGTSIIIKLPLTLAIMQGLLVRVCDDIFAIPLASVLETVKLNRRNVCQINRREVIRLRDTVLPILSLREVLFDVSSSCGESKDMEGYVVVVGLAEQRLGMIVDELLGQEEVVIKSMGDYLGNTPGIAGATIMGDGRIRLIIDIAGLINMIRTV